MCGRFEGRIDPTRLSYRYGIDGEVIVYDFPPEYAPTMMAPVVISAAAGLELCLMKWGFLPRWAQDVKEAVKCFNARAETVREKPTFREAVNQRRCLVPVTSYFEWKAEEGEKRKTKYRFRVPKEEIFSLAGIWTPWTSASGLTLLSFTILTTRPNELAAQYHHRMPLILPREREMDWVREEGDFASLLETEPFSGQEMEVEKVFVS